MFPRNDINAEYSLMTFRVFVGRGIISHRKSSIQPINDVIYQEAKLRYMLVMLDYSFRVKCLSR